MGASCEGNPTTYCSCQDWWEGSKQGHLPCLGFPEKGRWALRAMWGVWKHEQQERRALSNKPLPLFLFPCSQLLQQFPPEWCWRLKLLHLTSGLRNLGVLGCWQHCLAGWNQKSPKNYGVTEQDQGTSMEGLVLAPSSACLWSEKCKQLI